MSTVAGLGLSPDLTSKWTFLYFSFLARKMQISSYHMAVLSKPNECLSAERGGRASTAPAVTYRQCCLCLIAGHPPPDSPAV